MGLAVGLTLGVDGDVELAESVVGVVEALGLSALQPTTNQSQGKVRSTIVELDMSSLEAFKS